MTLDIETKYGLYSAYFVQDENDRGYTGWFTDIPAVVAQGEDIGECCEELEISLHCLLDYKAQESAKNIVEECLG